MAERDLNVSIKLKSHESNKQEIEFVNRLVSELDAKTDQRLKDKEKQLTDIEKRQQQRERDRQQAIKQTEAATRQMTQAMLSAATGATQLARSIVLLTAANEKDARVALRRIALFEGTIQGLRGVISTLSAASKAWEAYSAARAAGTGIGLGGILASAGIGRPGQIAGTFALSAGAVYGINQFARSRTFARHIPDNLFGVEGLGRAFLRTGAAFGGGDAFWDELDFRHALRRGFTGPDLAGPYAEAAYQRGIPISRLRDQIGLSRAMRSGRAGLGGALGAQAANEAGIEWHRRRRANADAALRQGGGTFAERIDNQRIAGESARAEMQMLQQRFDLSMRVTQAELARDTRRLQTLEREMQLVTGLAHMAPSQLHQVARFAEDARAGNVSLQGAAILRRSGVADLPGIREGVQKAEAEQLRSVLGKDRAKSAFNLDLDKFGQMQVEFKNLEAKIEHNVKVISNREQAEIEFMQALEPELIGLEERMVQAAARGTRLAIERAVHQLREGENVKEGSPIQLNLLPNVNFNF